MGKQLITQGSGCVNLLPILILDFSLQVPQEIIEQQNLFRVTVVSSQCQAKTNVIVSLSLQWLVSRQSELMPSNLCHIFTLSIEKGASF